MNTAGSVAPGYVRAGSGVGQADIPSERGWCQEGFPTGGAGGRVTRPPNPMFKTAALDLRRLIL